MFTFNVTIHSSRFIHNSVCTVQCSVFHSPVFTVQVQRSLFKCSKSMFKSRVQSSMSRFSVQCSMMVLGYQKCMSGVHRSPVFDTHSGVSQCPLPGSLVHKVTPDDDQVPCTNCSLQFLRYSC